MSTIGLVGVILVALFFLGALIATTIVVLGFALGWFRIGAGKTDGNRHVRFTMKENKVLDDIHTVRDRVHDLGHREKDRTTSLPEPSKDATAPAA